MDDADARAILREHGVDGVPARGRLSPELKARAEELRAGGDSYADGTSPADFLAADEPGDEPPPAPVAERKPRRVKTSRPSLRDRLKSGPDTKAKVKRKHPRVPVDRLVGHVWSLASKLSESFAPATSRCLAMESDLAGVVMEDVIRGSVVDRALQPLARAEDKGKTVLALAGPPAIVMGLEMAQGLPPEQREVRQAILFPMLREAIALQVEMLGDRASEVRERAERRAEVYEEVDRRLRFILGPMLAPPPEDEDVARAQEMAGV